MDFWAYFGPFSLVNRDQQKMADLQRKMASNQKMQENKPTLQFNFTIEKGDQFRFLNFLALAAPISLSPSGYVGNNIYVYILRESWVLLIVRSDGDTLKIGLAPCQQCPRSGSLEIVLNSYNLTFPL